MNRSNKKQLTLKNRKEAVKRRRICLGKKVKEFQIIKRNAY